MTRNADIDHDLMQKDEPAQEVVRKHSRPRDSVAYESRKKSKSKRVSSKQTSPKMASPLAQINETRLKVQPMAN